jgi:hypothetical protein
MGSLMKRTQQVEKNKRYLAIGVTAAGVALATMASAPFLGGAVMVAGGWLAWDWFKFRAKNGMRF